jgi:2-keto-4-pentenoate hydratase/2-oxohepta-3-ene-1,7-dioic acid hydratase in catechol pathway
MRVAKFRTPSGEIRTGDWKNGDIISEGDVFPVTNVDVLPPTEPSKILGVGPNYYSNIKYYEREEPVTPSDLLVFVKTVPNALVGHGDTATLRPPGEFYFEGELGVVIGERCCDVSRQEALDYVEGYTCVNEITNKDISESQYDIGNRVRTKSFDDSLPIGPVVASPEEVPDDASLELRINGDVRQHDVISQLIHPVPDLLDEISTYVTLEPGDVIATGSPKGVDQLSDGDRVAVEIEGIGVLEHDVSIPHE